MTINRAQKAVLLACAAMVAAMLLYPPVQIRGFGQGYSWIFDMRPGLTVNGVQLLVQWVGVCLVGVCLVGGIAYLLAGAAAPGESSPHARGRWAGVAALAAVAGSAATWGVLEVSRQTDGASSQSAGGMGAKEPNPFDEFDEPPKSRAARP